MAAGCVTDHHEGVSLRGHLVYEKEMDSRGINESSKSKKICGLDKDPGTRAFNPACDTGGCRERKCPASNICRVRSRAGTNQTLSLWPPAPSSSCPSCLPLGTSPLPHRLRQTDRQSHYSPLPKPRTQSSTAFPIPPADRHHKVPQTPTPGTLRQKASLCPTLSPTARPGPKKQTLCAPRGQSESTSIGLASGGGE